MWGSGTVVSLAQAQRADDAAAYNGPGAGADEV